MSRHKRLDIREILRNPVTRRRIMAQVIVATQAREGIDTTLEQAYAAYDRIQEERRRGKS